MSYIGGGYANPKPLGQMTDITPVPAPQPQPEQQDPK